MADKLFIGGVDPDKERCLRCGSWYLDTGWECNDCGYDNMPHYANPEQIAAAAKPSGEDSND